MDLLEYVKITFKEGEPIFISELTGKFGKNVRQELKVLTDKGLLGRYLNGVYYIPFTVFGIPGGIVDEDYIEKKYIRNKFNKNSDEIYGYITGGRLINYYGLTTQNFYTIEVRSNLATTEQREFYIGTKKIVIKKPFVEINKDNYRYLQLLDLIYEYDNYTELSNKDMIDKLKKELNLLNLNFDKIKEYIDYYPIRIYKEFYRGGFYELLAK
jgi:hypothetical protein